MYGQTGLRDFPAPPAITQAKPEHPNICNKYDVKTTSKAVTLKWDHEYTDKRSPLRKFR